MPVVIPIIAAWAASAAVTYFGLVGFWALAAKFAIYAVVTYLGNKMAGGRKSAAQSGPERKELLKNPIPPRRLAYGECRIGGSLAFIEKQGEGNDCILDMVILLGEGEFESINPVYWMNDKRSDNPDISNKILKFEYRLGTPDQTAFVIEGQEKKWTKDHKLSGIACVYLRIKYRKTNDNYDWPNGVPVPNFWVKGRKVIDPVSPSAPRTYSNNVARVMLDVITHPSIIKARSDEINYESFAEAASICAQQVPCLDLMKPGYIERYTANGTILLDQTPASIIETIETACLGQLLIDSGMFCLKVGAAYPSEFTVRPWMIKSEVQITQLKERRSSFNTITGEYVEPAIDSTQVAYAQQQDDDLLDEDEGEVNVQSQDFPLTTSSGTCQRMARILLNKNKNQTLLTFDMDIFGVKVKPYATVTLEDVVFPGAKIYRVASRKFLEGGNIQVTVSSIDYEHEFDWDPATEEPVLAYGSNEIISDRPILESLVATLSGSGTGTSGETLPPFYISLTYKKPRYWGLVLNWVNGLEFTPTWNEFTYVIRWKPKGATEWTGETTTFAENYIINLGAGVQSEQQWIVQVTANENNFDSTNTIRTPGYPRYAVTGSLYAGSAVDPGNLPAPITYGTWNRIWGWGFNWQENPSVFSAGYQVEWRSPDSPYADWQTIDFADPNTNTYSSTIITGQLIQWRIRGKNAIGYGAWSAISEAGFFEGGGS